MKNFYSVLLLICSNLYAAEQPFTVDYELKNTPQQDSTHTKSFTTVLMTNKSFEIPDYKENNNINSVEVLLAPISENEVLVSNTFVVEGKEYTPMMTVLLGEEASFTNENISLTITVSPYVPEGE